MPAARVGLSPRRSSFPTTGLKTTASTAAKISGSTISLTAANAVTTIDRRHHEPHEAPGPDAELGNRAHDTGRC